MTDVRIPTVRVESPQQQISRYIEENHPAISFAFGPHGLVIDKPVHTEWGLGVAMDFKGMLITYKLDGTQLTKSDGTWATPDIAREASMLDAYIRRKWIAQFAVGVHEVKMLVDSYLEGTS